MSIALCKCKDPRQWGIEGDFARACILCGGLIPLHKREEARENQKRHLSRRDKGV